MKLKCLVLLHMFGIFDCSNAAKQNGSWQSIIEQVRQLNLPEPQLVFTEALRDITSLEDMESKQQQLAQTWRNVSVYQPTQSCERVTLAAIENALKAQMLRLDLAVKLQSSSPEYTDSIYRLEQHQLWYKYLTYWWLGEDVSPSALYAVGESAFTQAIQQLRQVRQALPNKHGLNAVSSDNDANIKKHYADVAALVDTHLSDLFIKHIGLDKLKIERSLQDETFPAPGYYNTSLNTMYYHPLSRQYGFEQADWLYLHEGIPGHHYQSQLAEQSKTCTSSLTNYGRMALVEGWGAYVETLGKSLGLYTDPSSQQFALKWQALRAMRVMIDVGIHAKGWSVKQARAHWRQNFPEGEDVMEREIQRIGRWPMQVNTYVYGKYKIEQLKQQLQQNPTFDVRIFHDNVLKISHLSVNALNQYHFLYPAQ